MKGPWDIGALVLKSRKFLKVGYFRTLNPKITFFLKRSRHMAPKIKFLKICAKRF